MTSGEALKRVHASMDAILWRENQPQWAPAFAQVRDRIRIDATLDTANIDAQGQINIGLALAESLPIKQLGYVIAHEVSHPMLEYFQRLPPGGDAELFNIAQDCIINDSIISDAGGDDALPEWVCRTPKDYTGPLQTEAIYAWMRQNPDKAPKPKRSASGKALPGAGCGTPSAPSASGDPGAGPSAGPDWSVVVNQVRAVDALVGKGSAICSVIAPGKPFSTFAQLLRFGTRQADTSAGREIRTYARASRRDGPSGIILPGYQGGVPQFAIVVDASSSMSRDWIARIVAEIICLAREFQRVKFYLVTHTDRVVWSGWVTSKGAGAQVPEACAFAGGTFVTPAYEHLARVAKRWDAILHFTDCEVETPWPQAPTRKLIVGAFGLGAFKPWSKPPAGSTVIACRDPDHDVMRGAA